MVGNDYIFKAKGFLAFIDNARYSVKKKGIREIDFPIGYKKGKLKLRFNRMSANVC